MISPVDMTVVLFRVLLTMQPAVSRHETEQDRSDRLLLVAHSITRAVEVATCGGGSWGEDCIPRWKGSPVELASAVGSSGQWESGYTKRVHTCQCLPGECDDGHARGPWQIHPEPCRGAQCNWAVTRELYDQIQGADETSTVAAALAATIKITNGQRLCKTVPGALNAYARGGCADFEHTEARVALYKHFLAAYRRIESETNREALTE
jgi:hypothetical protein